MNNPECYIYI